MSETNNITPNDLLWAHHQRTIRHNCYEYNGSWYIPGAPHIKFDSESSALRVMLDKAILIDDIPDSAILVTLWYRRNTHTRAYEFNHLEDGVTATAHMPTIKHPDHKKTWMSSKWISIVGYKTSNNIVHAFN